MMLHILLPLFLLTLIVCGIESSIFGEEKRHVNLYLYTHHHNLLLGVVPPKLYTRLNNTFEVSCYVHGIDGILNFYDGDLLVNESLIKV